MKKQVFLLVLISLVFSFSSANAQSRYYRRSQPKFGDSARKYRWLDRY